MFRQFSLHADKRQMLETLMNSLATQPQPGRILWELACCVASSVGADGFILHLVHPQTGMFRVFRRYCVCFISCAAGSYKSWLESVLLSFKL